MAIVFQGSSNTTVNVTNGDELVTYDYAYLTSQSSGVVLLAGSSETSLINYGHILANQGVNIQADTSRIQNFGDINAINSDAINLGGAGGSHEIVNFGNITSFSYIIDVFNNSGPVNIYLTNAGSIVSTGGSSIIYDGTIASAHVSNSGYMRGGEIGMSGTGESRFHNTGTIECSAIDMNADVGAYFINQGSISGYNETVNIFGSGISDTFRNSGSIFGDIDLNAGGDSFANYLNGIVVGTVFGDLGNDTMIGSSSADIFDGGADADFMRGRLGDDTLLGGSEDDRLYGEEGNDRLQGDAGNDAIFGGAGEDVIVGGNGLDVLFGGADADTFVYNSFADSEEGGLFDRIRDFTPGEDKINLSGVAAGIDFVTAFTGTGPEVRAFKTSAGLQLVQVDYNGDGAADMRIALLGTDVLATENDFIL